MEKYVELKIHDMSTTLYPADAYALVLEEVGGNRKIPVIIGHLKRNAKAMASEVRASILISSPPFSK